MHTAHVSPELSQRRLIEGDLEVYGSLIGLSKRCDLASIEAAMHAMSADDHELEFSPEDTPIRAFKQEEDEEKLYFSA